MIELFARSVSVLDREGALIPVHIDDSVSSLSAILLDEAYYEALLEGRDIIEGISVLKPAWLIPFKAKAWLDLRKKAEEGIHVDSRDIKKHKNDILRISSELAPGFCDLPETVKNDLREFIHKLLVTDAELKNLGITGVHEADMKQVLMDIYKL